MHESPFWSSQPPPTTEQQHLLQTEYYSSRKREVLEKRPKDPGSDLTHLAKTAITSYLQRDAPHPPVNLLSLIKNDLIDTSPTMNISQFNTAMCYNMDLLIKRELLSQMLHK